MILLEIINMVLKIFAIDPQEIIPALIGEEQVGISYQKVKDPSCLNKPYHPFTVEQINQDG
jgi:hypothetical protein